MPQSSTVLEAGLTPRQEVEEQLDENTPRNNLIEICSRYEQRLRRVLEKLGPARTYQSNSEAIRLSENAMLSLKYELREPKVTIERYKSALITLVTNLRELETTAMART